MRRPLLSLAGLFAAGCLLIDGESGPGEPLVLVLLAAFLLGLAFAAGEGRRSWAALAAAALALGVAAAEVEGLQFEAGSLRRRFLRDAPEGRALRVVGTVSGDAVETAGHLVLVLDVEGVEAEGRLEPARGRARIEVDGSRAKPRLLDGERVAAWATLRALPWARSASEGLAASGVCKSVLLLERREGSGAAWPRRAAAVVREAARRVLMRSILPGTERGLVLAMVLGDRSEIDDPTAESFRASGTYHVLALSGAQVALVAGLIVAALRRMRASPWAQALVTATATFGYALLVGGDVPVVRAALMASAILAGRALELDSDASNLLGLAGLLLLGHRPAAAADVGFQLSFGATLGILALADPLSRGVPRLPFRAEVAIAASVAVQGVLAPVLAAWFHRLAPAAVLLNL
ncbi:MAG TPA: ComEC/Rec2 family competence protein, partial [Vicinamibacteria bacterium]|nr:ComEC/Rec2 family competence protein [Vicinamibacteria bacterium]